MYYPLRNASARIMATNDGSLYGLGVRTQIAPGTDQVGTVQAISVETGDLLWKQEQRAATTLMATGGGLVFGGDHNGRFRALDHETGEVLWEINLGSPVTGFPRHLRRRWTAVRRGQHRPVADVGRLQPPDAGAAPEQRQHAVRLRAAEALPGGRRYLPIDRQAATLFFQLISRRYERGPMILSSNQSFGSWCDVFGDRVIASAILDRILHHATTISIRGDSYRMKDKLKSGVVKPTTAGA